MQACIEWQGRKDRGGYGIAYIRVGTKKTTTTAHRRAWLRAHGAIQSGLHVAHHCDNPSCINLDHLFLATPTQNEHDKMDKGRQLGAKLTAQKVLEIRASDLPLKRLAAVYGISMGHASNVRNHKLWRQI